MDFDERLQRAVQRGKRRQESHAEEARAQALSAEELKRLHSKYRLEVSEHIEACLKRLEAHFPGFQHETIFGDRGWGAACSRDDLKLESGGRRSNQFSRLEVTVRPHSEYQVLDIQSKGTIRNRELFQRRHYEPIAEADPAQFCERIDGWIVEFAELFAAS